MPPQCLDKHVSKVASERKGASCMDGELLLLIMADPVDTLLIWVSNSCLHHSHAFDCARDQWVRFKALDSVRNHLQCDSQTTTRPAVLPGQYCAGSHEWVPRPVVQRTLWERVLTDQSPVTHLHTSVRGAPPPFWLKPCAVVLGTSGHRSHLYDPCLPSQPALLWRAGCRFVILPSWFSTC